VLSELIAGNFENDVTHETGEAMHVWAISIVQYDIALVQNHTLIGAIYERSTAHEQRQEYRVLLSRPQMDGQSLDHMLVPGNINKLDGAEVNISKSGLEAVGFQARAGQADNVLSALFLPVGDPVGGWDDPGVERRYWSSSQVSMQLHPSLPWYRPAAIVSFSPRYGSAPSGSNNLLPPATCAR